MHRGAVLWSQSQNLPEHRLTWTPRILKVYQLTNNFASIFVLFINIFTFSDNDIHSVLQWNPTGPPQGWSPPLFQAIPGPHWRVRTLPRELSSMISRTCHGLQWKMIIASGTWPLDRDLPSLKEQDRAGRSECLHAKLYGHCSVHSWEEEMKESQEGKSTSLL